MQTQELAMNFFEQAKIRVKDPSLVRSFSFQPEKKPFDGFFVHQEYSDLSCHEAVKPMIESGCGFLSLQETLDILSTDIGQRILNTETIAIPIFAHDKLLGVHINNTPMRYTLAIRQRELTWEWTLTRMRGFCLFGYPGSFLNE